MKTTTKKNVAPVGSMWMGKDSNGLSITASVTSEPIPGNDLRHVTITSRNYSTSSDSGVIGAKWFKYATRIG